MILNIVHFKISTENINSQQDNVTHEPNLERQKPMAKESTALTEMGN